MGLAVSSHSAWREQFSLPGTPDVRMLLFKTWLKGPFFQVPCGPVLTFPSIDDMNLK